MNALFTINPYKWRGQWVFDDAHTGANKEALVAGTDTMLDLWCAQLKCKPEKGLIVVFSSTVFPGYNLKAIKSDKDGGSGTWYNAMNMDFWLCPFLTRYLNPPPHEIYAQIKQAT